MFRAPGVGEMGTTLREVLVAILEEIERQREEGVTRREFPEFAERKRRTFRGHGRA